MEMLNILLNYLFVLGEISDYITQEKKKFAN